MLQVHTCHMPIIWTGTKCHPSAEFRRIYKEAYGEEITTAEAEEMTRRLLALYKLVLRPLPTERAQCPPEPLLPAQSAPEAS